MIRRKHNTITGGYYEGGSRCVINHLDEIFLGNERVTECHEMERKRFWAAAVALRSRGLENIFDTVGSG